MNWLIEKETKQNWKRIGHDQMGAVVTTSQAIN